MDEVTYLNFGTFADARGRLVFGEVGEHIPFAMERMYYMKDVPAGTVRAGVMHRELEQVFVAVQGSFEVTVDDGSLSEEARKVWRVANEGQALYVPPGLWREVGGFSADAICLVLVSHGHDPEEQEKDYAAFLRGVRG